MQSLIQCLAEQCFVELDGVPTDKQRRRPPEEPGAHFANHRVVGMKRWVGQTRRARSTQPHRFRARHDMWLQPASHLEALEFP